MIVLAEARPCRVCAYAERETDVHRKALFASVLRRGNCAAWSDAVRATPVEERRCPCGGLEPQSPALAALIAGCNRRRRQTVGLAMEFRPRGVWPGGGE